MKRKKQSLPVYIFFLLLAVSNVANALPIVAAVEYDFNDGTLQGWSPTPPFGGTLFHDFRLVGGNPDGFMVASDSVAGGSLLARAPTPVFPSLGGRYDRLVGIQWDEFILPPSGDRVTTSTFAILEGADGTRYGSDRTITGINTWNTITAGFLPSDFTYIGGGFSSLSQVVEDIFLHNTGALYFSMDTSTGAGRESYIDNVAFLYTVPEPGTLALLLAAALMAGCLPYRRQRQGADQLQLSVPYQ